MLLRDDSIMLSFLIAQGFLPAFLPCLLSYLARLRLCLFHLFLRRSTDSRDFVLSGEEAQLSLTGCSVSPVMNSAICCYKDLGHQKKLRTGLVICVDCDQFPVKIQV